jgi:hypothetical protein
MSGGPCERSHTDVRAGPQRSMEAQRRGSRRSGEFAQGITYCEAGLRHAEITPFVVDLLGYERQLCEARDTGCHTVGEIEEGADDEEPRGTVH